MAKSKPRSLRGIVYENRSVNRTLSFVLDSAAPVAPAEVALRPSSDLGRSDSDRVTSTPTLTFSLDIADDGRVDVFVDGVAHAYAQLTAGSNEITLENVEAGTHQVTATLTDLAGNVSPLSDPLEVTVDLTDPDFVDAEFALPPLGSDEGVVSGTTEPSATVTLYRGLDSNLPIGTAIADLSGAFSIAGVKVRDGLNRFRVSAADLAGNAINTELAVQYDAPDLSPPEIQLYLANDTGASETDRLTNDPTVMGMVDDASRISSFRVSVNGGAFVNSLGSLRDGRFELSRGVLETIAGQPLPDGDVSVRMQASDEVGHISLIRDLTFELDTVRPDTPAPLTLDPASDSGELGDGLTNASSLTFSTSIAAADADIVLFADGNEVARHVGGGSASFAIPVEEGRQRYVAQSVDEAGNVSFFTAPRFVTVDQQFTTPTVALSSTLQRFDLGGTNHTDSPVVSLRGIAEEGTRLELEGLPNFATADAFDRYVIEDVTLQPGANPFRVLASDAAGNRAEVEIEIVYHDLAGPVFDLRLANDTGVSDRDSRTQDPTVSGLVTDASEVVLLTGSLDGLPPVDITSALNEDSLLLDLAALETVFGDTLPDGRHLLSLVATDAAGNESIADIQFDLDRTGPPVDTPPDLLTSSDRGFDAFDNLTSDTEPVLRLYSERGALVTFFLDGSEIGSVVSTGVAQFTTPALATGTYEVTATVQDAAGNLAGPSTPLLLTIDAEAPALTAFGLAEVHRSAVSETHTTDENVTLVGSAEPGSRVTLSGQPGNGVADANGDFSFATSLVGGENEYVLSVEDEAGNLTEQVIVFTRGELLPPRFDLTLIDNGSLAPPEITGQLRSENPLATAVLSSDAELEGAIDLLPYLSNGGFSLDATELEVLRGAPFPTGDHTLYFSATDDQGRISELTEVTFTIDGSTQAELQSLVTPLGGGDYQFSVTASGPADLGQRLESISIPVDSLVTASQLIAPPNWTVTYSTGDEAIVWTVDDPRNGLVAGESMVLSFVADSAPTPGAAQTVLSDLGSGDARTVSVPLAVPAAAGLTAVTDYYSTTAGQTLTIDAGQGLLANDATDAPPVESFDATTRWGAAVSVNGDGSFSLVPGQAYAGLAVGESIDDSFTYTVRNAGGQIAGARVVVTVTGINSAPRGVDDSPTAETPSLYTRANAPLAIDSQDLVRNDVDPNVNDQLAVAAVDAVSELGAVLSLVDGEVNYDPSAVPLLNQLPAGQSQLDRFTYTVTDPFGLTSTAVAEVWVQSPINVAPTGAPTSTSLTEGGELTDLDFAGLLAGASDSDRLPRDPELSVVAETVVSSRGAAVTLLADGSFFYDPTGAADVEGLSPGESIDDTFEFRVTDGTDASAPAVVSLTVSGENTPPTAVDDGYGPLLADGVADDDSVERFAQQRL